MVRLGNNSSLREYASRLVNLHRLIAKNLGDSAEADDLRDEMDLPWRQLSQDELSLVDGLSVDLYEIHEPLNRHPPFSAEAQTLFDGAIKERDWPQLLSLVRENREKAPSCVVAFYRGLAWMNLESPEVAAEFYESAFRSGLQRVDLQFWLLETFIQAGRLRDAVPIAQDLIERSSDPSVVLAAVKVLSLSAELANADATKLHLQAVSAGDRVIADLSLPTDDVGLNKQVASTCLHMALSYSQLNQNDKARQACQLVFKIDPGCLDAFMVLGLLEYDIQGMKPDSRTRIKVAQRIDDHFGSLRPALLSVQCALEPDGQTASAPSSSLN